MAGNKQQHLTKEQIKNHLSDSGVSLAELTAHMVVEDLELLKPLLELSCMETGPWAQRASRVISIVAFRYPKIIMPFIKEMVNSMGILKSEGARRNFLKVFSEASIRFTQSNKAILLNLCFEYLGGTYSVAVKVYSMDILYRLSREIPEIRKELYDLIEDQIDESSAGFISRGNKIMQKITRDLKTSP